MVRASVLPVQVLRLALAVSLAGAACSHEATPSAPAPKTASLSPDLLPHDGAKTVPAPPKSKQRPAADPDADVNGPNASHSLLARLPKDSLVVVHCARLESLKEAWARSSLSRTLQQPQFAASFDAGLKQATAELDAARAATPQWNKLFDLAPRLRGSLALAITGLEPASGGAPFTGLALIELDHAQAGELEQALEPLLEAMHDSVGPKGVFVRKEKGWGAEFGDETFFVDLWREGDGFSACFGPRQAVRARAAKRAILQNADSFLASDIKRATPPLTGEGTSPVFELYLQTTQVWTLIRRAAPPEVFEVLRRTGIIHVDGASIAMALGPKGISEALTWCSVGCSDVLSRALTAKPLDTKLARYVAPRAESVGLYSLDLVTLTSDILAVLPEAPRRELERKVGDLRRFKSIDLQQDLIENTGPTFAVMTQGDISDWMQRGVPRICAAVQIADREKADRLISRAIAAGSPARIQTLTGTPGTWPVREIGPPDQDAPSPRLTWCLTNDCLLVSTDRELLLASLAAAASSDPCPHEDLRAALANVDAKCFSVSITEGSTAPLPTIAYGRRTTYGLVLEAREGSGALVFGGLLANLSVLSAVAIPRLLEARIGANEAAALARVKSLASSEAEVMDRVALDLDHDAIGEALLLQELTGSSRLRGCKKPLSPPATVPMTFLQEGVGTNNGYAYRVDLPATNGGMTSQSLARDGLDICADEAEISFWIYAWPLEPGKTGRKVFAYSSEGDLWVSDNLGSGQGYSGAEVQPTFNATETVDAPKGAEADASPSHRGRDGGTWVRLEF
jgi:hypothetical protein